MENDAKNELSISPPFKALKVDGSAIKNRVDAHLHVPAKNVGGRPKKTDNKLSLKQRCFLEHLCAGKSTLEAYKLAGYKGKAKSAYQLRYELKGQLIELLEAEGVSRDGIMVEVKKLMDIPVAQQMVNVDQKVKILRFLATLIPEEAKAKPKITPFVIAINNAENVKIDDIPNSEK